MENINVKKFIKDIEKVYIKYNLSISHEDKQGSFIIEKYKDENVDWLKNATNNRDRLGE